MPTRSARPAIEPETLALAAALAEARRASPLEVITAGVEGQSDDPFIAGEAERRIDAWRSGTAVPIDNLVFPCAGPVLLEKLGSWVDDAITAPFFRLGYGCRAADRGMAVAPVARGFFNVNPDAKTRPEWDGVRVVSVRHGLPVLHGWGAGWTALSDDARPRRWATTFFVAVGGGWVDADSGDAGPPWDADDAAVDAFLQTLVIAGGAWNRNPIRWVGGL